MEGGEEVEFIFVEVLFMGYSCTLFKVNSIFCCVIYYVIQLYYVMCPHNLWIICLLQLGHSYWKTGVGFLATSPWQQQRWSCRGNTWFLR